MYVFFFSSRRRHTICALVTGVQTCALPIFALGMSEPEAGSDVAAIQSRAREVDGGWVLDGQKMFTTNGHLADYVFMLVRTDPESERHRGLTTFLVPLDLEGVEAQAVFTVSRARTTIPYSSEVFLADRSRIRERCARWPHRQ